MVLRRPRHTCQLLAAALFVATLALPLPTRADPLLMFVLGFAKNLIESSLQESKARPGAEANVTVPEPAPVAKAPSSMDQDDLRVLIDESFVYLSRSQRAELLAGLEKALADPANSAYREAILTQFVAVARQVQYTHGQLNRLSPEDKRALAERFAANFRTLSVEQQQALLEQLRLRALPLPTDLNDMMLAALTPAPQ